MEGPGRYRNDRIIDVLPDGRALEYSELAPATVGR
jgi:hypothetical protein